jgi:hypothetical protein
MVFAALIKSFLILLGATTAGGITITLEFSGSPTVEHGLGTAHTGLHRDGVSRTISGAGAALHAGVPVLEDCF